MACASFLPVSSRFDRSVSTEPRLQLTGGAATRTIRFVEALRLSYLARISTGMSACVQLSRMELDWLVIMSHVRCRYSLSRTKPITLTADGIRSGTLFMRATVADEGGPCLAVA
jgi:hypothetical protein